MVIIIVIVILAVGFFGLVGWLGIGLWAKVEHDQKKAEANAPAILDETFDGRQDVTFNLHQGTLKFDTVVVGAKERGYKLAHQAGEPTGSMTLLFEKVAAAS